MLQTYGVKPLLYGLSGYDPVVLGGAVAALALAWH
jgi:hypothetical protein